MLHNVLHFLKTKVFEVLIWFEPFCGFKCRILLVSRSFKDGFNQMINNKRVLERWERQSNLIIDFAMLRFIWNYLNNFFSQWRFLLAHLSPWLEMSVQESRRSYQLCSEKWRLFQVSNEVWKTSQLDILLLLFCLKKKRSSSQVRI